MTGAPGSTVDVIVIGGGPAGENAAEYAVAGSSRTGVIVEAALVGGECSYWACMPSKALLRPLEVASAARNLEGISNPEIVGDELLARRDTWRSHLDDSRQVSWAQSVGFDIVRGTGRLIGERQVEVTPQEGEPRVFTARDAVVLATGSAPVIPGHYASVAPWTSRDATGVAEVPERLAIVGGGVVACEAARWLAALGSQVTMLVRGERLLPRFEEFAARAVADGLRDVGVEMRFGADIATVDRTDVSRDPQTGHLHGGEVVLGLREGHDLHADELLVATGRRPATDGLGLDAVGLSPADLDGRHDLGNGWLYAVGDVSGGAPLTHWGKYQGRLAGELIAARAEGREPGPAPLDAPVPQVVFTDPQVAQVGITAADAADAGRSVRVVDQPLSAAAGFGLLRDDLVGSARLVIEGDRIVGATFAGPEVAELLHAATIAIVASVPLATLRHAVAAYPTASEIWLRLIETATRS